MTDIVEVAETLEANAAEMRAGYDAAEPDLRYAAEALRTHRCVAPVDIPTWPMIPGLVELRDRVGMPQTATLVETIAKANAVLAAHANLCR